MLVTDLKESKNNLYRVFVDEEYVFSLYKNELTKFHIQKNDMISKELCTYILDDVIYRRAKERALFLLEKKPFSVSMMKKRLRENLYPDNVIEKVIEFLDTYHYLDDKMYVTMYVNTYQSKKSRLQIIYDLSRKGIPKDMVLEYFDTRDYSEEICFEQQFFKYTKNKDLSDYKERQKVFRYFLRKGFSTSLIEKYIK